MTEWSFVILIILYVASIVYLWLGWEKIPVAINEYIASSVTVLIPVRNEADNLLVLLNSLANQTYKGPLTIFIIDDYSKDDTKELAQNFIKTHANVTFFSLKDKTGKKAAIAAGIAYSNADIILTIDGDCKAPATWVETMVSAFNKDTQFVSGPVVFSNGVSLFANIQAIEFTSLIGSGASLIGWGKPMMASGANMGFRRKAFYEVNGFEGNEDTASGDDVFLLHKIAKQYPDGIAFVKQQAGIIETKAQPNLTSFVRQRIRWASKWNAYQDVFTKASAVLVFLLSLSIILYPILVEFKSLSIFLWINLLVIKSFFDFFFIRQVSRFLGNQIHVLAFILLQLIYPLYVVLIALLSFQKTYVWKGRKVQ